MRGTGREERRGEGRKVFEGVGAGGEGFGKAPGGGGGFGGMERRGRGGTGGGLFVPENRAHLQDRRAVSLLVDLLLCIRRAGHLCVVPLSSTIIKL